MKNNRKEECYMKEEMGIYIHIPFCKKKCYYCDFISFANQDKWSTQYIEALKKEIQQNKEKANCARITTIYIGGGTPSYLDSKLIIEILDVIRKNYAVEKDAEITIEVNPRVVTKEKLEMYYSKGVNRISIGLQTTNNQLLNEIGRIHTYEEFLETYHMVREGGFDNVNIDLMFGLPSQTEEILQESLEKVILLKPEHISIYSLILEEGTVLEDLVRQGKRILPKEEIERNMYWQTKTILEENGYVHYEISNFSKPEKQSKHNMNCWRQKSYLGFGLAAHSYYHKTRYSNTEDLEQYINDKGYTKIIHEIQTNQEEKKEFMMLGLRRIEGVLISEFKNKFIDNPIYLFRKELSKLVEQELIELGTNNIKLTNKGIDLANLVWQEFV